MNKSKVWHLLTVCLASFAMPILVSAQQAPLPAKTAAPPPPELQKLEEGEAPAVTIRKQGEGNNNITETRQQGRVTEAKVKSGGSTYYVKPPSQAGTLQPGESLPRGAEWRIKEFDLGQKVRKPGQAVQSDNDAGLPPPAATPQKN